MESNASSVTRRPTGTPPSTSPGPGGLRGRLARGEFAVTAEISPPRGADPKAIRHSAEPLRGWVDAVNITDNAGAHVRMASWAGSLLAAEAGVEPVMQVTCRDRNRLALQSDLIGAGALGIPNVLLMTGDHPKFGDHPDGKPVFDLDGMELIRAARAMRDEGVLLSGRTLSVRPEWFIGAVENPFGAPAGLRAGILGKRAAAGAEFVQTQFVFDVAAFARWMAEVRDLGLDQRCRILAGAGPVRSLAALGRLRTLPGIHIPGEVERRLRAVPADQVAQEGLALCAEIIEQVRDIPGVSGIHVMASGFERGIPEILDRAGLPRRPSPAPDRQQETPRAH
jgi:methylenetetrahydrofolate reductase (NADPH)